MGLPNTELGEQTAMSCVILQLSLPGLPVLAPGSLRNGNKVRAVCLGILTRFMMTHTGGG